MPLCRQPGD